MELGQWRHENEDSKIKGGMPVSFWEKQQKQKVIVEGNSAYCNVDIGKGKPLKVYVGMARQYVTNAVVDISPLEIEVSDRGATATIINEFTRSITKREENSSLWVGTLQLYSARPEHSIFAEREIRQTDVPLKAYTFTRDGVLLEGIDIVDNTVSVGRKQSKKHNGHEQLEFVLLDKFKPPKIDNGKINNVWLKRFTTQKGAQMKSFEATNAISKGAVVRCKLDNEKEQIPGRVEFIAGEPDRIAHGVICKRWDSWKADSDDLVVLKEGDAIKIFTTILYVESGELKAEIFWKRTDKSETVEQWTNRILKEKKLGQFVNPVEKSDNTKYLHSGAVEINNTDPHSSLIVYHKEGNSLEFGYSGGGSQKVMDDEKILKMMGDPRWLPDIDLGEQANQTFTMGVIVELQSIFNGDPVNNPDLALTWLLRDLSGIRISPMVFEEIDIDYDQKSINYKIEPRFKKYMTAVFIDRLNIIDKIFSDHYGWRLAEFF